MMNENFDYTRITEEHKQAIKEVCRVCEEKGYQDLVQHFTATFELEPRERYDVNQNKFFQKCKEKDIHLNYQGYLIENGVEYPMFGLTGDLRHLEKLLD